MKGWISSLSAFLMSGLLVFALLTGCDAKPKPAEEKAKEKTTETQTVNYKCAKDDCPKTKELASDAPAPSC